MNKELFASFKKAFRMFAREFMFINQNMYHRELTVIQRHTILEIGEIPGSSLGQIAENLNTDRGNLSRTVNELVTMGYVDRKADPKNRRAVILNLTNEGKKINDAIGKMSKEYFMAVFSYIGEEHQKTVVHGLKFLAENMHRRNTAWAAFINRRTGKNKKKKKRDTEKG